MENSSVIFLAMCKGLLLGLEVLPKLIEVRSQAKKGGGATVVCAKTP